MGAVPVLPRVVVGVYPPHDEGGAVAPFPRRRRGVLPARLGVGMGLVGPNPAAGRGEGPALASAAAAAASSPEAGAGSSRGLPVPVPVPVATAIAATATAAAATVVVVLLLFLRHEALGAGQGGRRGHAGRIGRGRLRWRQSPGGGGPTTTARPVVRSRHAQHELLRGGAGDDHAEDGGAPVPELGGGGMGTGPGSQGGRRRRGERGRGRGSRKERVGGELRGCPVGLRGGRPHALSRSHVYVRPHYYARPSSPGRRPGPITAI